MADVTAPFARRTIEAGPEVSLAVRVLLSTAAFAAGAIHLVMAPSHAGESTIEGVGFLVAGWLQVALAVVLFTQASRLVLRATVLLNAGLIVLWAVSRVWGLPWGAHAWHPENVSSVDLTCVAIEAGLVVVAAALLTRPSFARALDGASLLTGVLVPVGVVALASGVLLSPSARSHASGSHGDHGAASGHHDSGGSASGGHGHDANTDDLGFSALSNGHQHGSGEVELDPRTQALLDEELDETRKLIDKYPTVADAEAAGYRRAGPFVPGLGTHYVNYGSYTGVSENALVGSYETMIPVLIYNGYKPDSEIAGFMYMANGPDGQPPEGFIGPNDHWHYHTNTCVAYKDGVIEAPFGADAENVTQEMCTEAGGFLIQNTGYMVHVWSVPGYESEDGMFSEVSRDLPCPDGTFYKKPVEEWGYAKSACRNTKPA